MLCLARDTRVSLILMKIVQKGTKHQPFHKAYTSVVLPRRQASVREEMYGNGEATTGKRAGWLEDLATIRWNVLDIVDYIANMPGS